MTNKEFDNEGNLKWERIVPPVYWGVIDDFVIADRHLPCGTRQHLISGKSKYTQPVDNAMVIGDTDIEVDYASYVSHMSTSEI